MFNVKDGYAEKQGFLDKFFWQADTKKIETVEKIEHVLNISKLVTFAVVGVGIYVLTRKK